MRSDRPNEKLSAVPSCFRFETSTPTRLHLLFFSLGMSSSASSSATVVETESKRKPKRKAAPQGSNQAAKKHAAAVPPVTPNKLEKVAALPALPLPDLAKEKPYSVETDFVFTDRGFGGPLREDEKKRCAAMREPGSVYSALSQEHKTKLGFGQEDRLERSNRLGTKAFSSRLATPLSEVVIQWRDDWEPKKTSEEKLFLWVQGDLFSCRGKCSPGRSFNCCESGRRTGLDVLKATIGYTGEEKSSILLPTFGPCSPLTACTDLKAASTVLLGRTVTSSLIIDTDEVLLSLVYIKEGYSDRKLEYNPRATALYRAWHSGTVDALEEPDEDEDEDDPDHQDGVPPRTWETIWGPALILYEHPVLQDEDKETISSPVVTPKKEHPSRH